MNKILVCVLSVFVGASCLADTVVLRSGKVINGSLRSAGPSNVHITVDGELMIFPTITVSSIEFEEREDSAAVEARQRVTDELPNGSELLLKVLSVRVVDNSRVDVIFKSLGPIDLSGGGQLSVGTLLEAHFPADSGTEWMAELKMDRALSETAEVTLQHQKVVDVTSGTESSVLYGRGQQEDDDLSALPKLIRVSRIVQIRFASDENDHAS